MTTVDVADYKRAAAKVRIAEASLTKKFREALGDAAKPLGEKVVKEGAEELPSRGGLRELVLDKSRIGVMPTGQGLSLVVRNPKVQQLGLIDSTGQLRHPVFARQAGSARGMMAGAKAAGLSGRIASKAVRKQRRHGWRWVSQSVTKASFSKAFEEGKGEAAEAVMSVVRETLGRIDS